MVYFRQGSAVFEPDYMDNETRCNQFIEHIKNLQANDIFSIYRVEYIGHASPEGSGTLNESLARRRAENFTKHLHKKLEFADSVVFMSSVSEDWVGLERLIANDPDLPNREQVMPIVRDESLGIYRERELKEKYPQAWKYMLNKHFPALRNFKTFIYIDFSTSIVLPEGVTTISNAAFNGCSGMTSIVIPDSVKRIGKSAFAGCSRLTEFTIPAGIGIIPEGMLRGCGGLTSITIPEGITEIDWISFENCGNLTSITIPKTVTAIGVWTFQGCGKLDTIVFEGTVQEWNAIFKNMEWSIGIPAQNVQCSDGTGSLADS
jgi:hypothetical protein